MKSFIKNLVITIIAIKVTSLYLTGLSFDNNVETLVIASVAFTLINIFVRPLIKIIMLPINIVTLGIFSWLVNVIILYLTVLLVPDFTVTSFFFPGVYYSGFTISSMFISTFWVAVLSSLSISVIYNMLSWVFD